MDFGQYSNLLIAANSYRATGASTWLFQQGMGFGEKEVWWDSKWEKRPFPHEGLDLVRFSDGSKIVNVFSGFCIVSPVTGVVVAVCDDFLAKTVWINVEGTPSKLVALCHMKSFVIPGQRLCCGDPVGVISYVGKNVPLHLHLSVLEGEWRKIERLTWDGVHTQSHARFVYPSF